MRDLGINLASRSKCYLHIAAFVSEQPLWTEAQEAPKWGLTSLLRACSSRENLKIAHHYIITGGGIDLPLVANLLIQLYCKFGSLEEVYSVFQSLPKKDVFCWTSYIKAHAQHGHATLSLNLYWHMLGKGVRPDKVLFLCVLGVCAELKDLASGAKVHGDICQQVELEGDVFLRTALVKMYGKCGRLDLAVLVFNDSAEKDVVLCNTIMAVCNQHDHSEETLQILEQMQLEGFVLNGPVFASVLGACGNLANVIYIKSVQVRIIHCGFGSHFMTGTALINAYSKCGSLKEAQNAFDKISQRDTIVWNTMIMSLTQHGQAKKALILYGEMQHEGCEPNQVSFVCGLSAVEEVAFLSQGKEIHMQVVEYGFDTHTSVGTALICMYGKCGSIQDAQVVFNKMPFPTVVSWTAVITAYGQNGYIKEAFCLYQRMLAEGIYPDKCTLITLLTVCSSLVALAESKKIHAATMCTELEHDDELQAALITMYGKGGSDEAACMVFCRKHSEMDVVWNAMLAAFIQHGHSRKALQLYRSMQSTGPKPDKLTYSTILSACCAMADLPQGKEIHASIRKANLEADLVVGTALVNMYAKCGSLPDAHKVFNQLGKRNAISWNALIVGYAQNGFAKESVALFEDMRREGVGANKITFTSVLYACSHTGFVEEALCLFRMMEEECEVKPSLEHYACVIDMLGRVGRLDDAEHIIKKYPYEPDAIMWMSLLGACRVHGDMGRGGHVAESVVQADPEKSGSYVLLSNIFAAEES